MVQIYRAILSQSGEDAPTALELQNDSFDGDWIRQSPGVYYKQTTIPNTVTGVWIGGGFGMGSNAHVFLPVHNFDVSPVGFYTMRYGFADLKLRITVEFYEATEFNQVDMETLLGAGNELFLPEIAVYT